MGLTKKHFEFLTLKWDSNLTYEQIAEKLKVRERTLYKWQKRKDFREAEETCIAKGVRDAEIVLGRNARRAAETMVLLTATENDPKTYEFRQSGETVLRAASAILKALGLGEKTSSEGESSDGGQDRLERDFYKTVGSLPDAELKLLTSMLRSRLGSPGTSKMGSRFGSPNGKT
jgi:hypothetical protein